MKGNFVCQDDFNYKKSGVFPIIFPVMHSVGCLSDKSALK